MEVKDRVETYSEKLRHRIAHVILFNSEGKMWLQLRSPTVSFCPRYWFTSVAGHVQTGESHIDAAVRETEEELGMLLGIEFLRKDLYDDVVR